MTLTPAQAWSALQDGNERFATGQLSHPRQDVARREELTDTQHPTVAIFGCSDSRAAAEVVFDLGLGDAFVIRNAGHIVSPAALGSLEYAVGILQVPLLLVLSHESCGAVRAAIDAQGANATPLPPHIAQLIEPIAPAVQRVTGVAAGTPIDPESVDARAVGREHLNLSIQAILEASEMISAAVADGNLAIVGANYRLHEGRAVQDIVVGLA